MITFGDGALDALVETVERFVGYHVAILPEGVQVEEGEMWRHDIEITSVDREGIAGHRLDAASEDTGERVDFTWPDVGRIHVY